MSQLSRRAFLRRAGQAISVALLAGCAAPVRANDLTAGVVSYTDRSAAPNRPPLALSAEQGLPLPDFSLDVKIGQMLLVGFSGRYLLESSAIIQDVRAGKAGNVVLFRHNLESPEQVKDLTATLQGAAAIPLLISIDQEGGYVSRLGAWSGVEPNFSAQYLGEQNNLDLTRAQGESTAAILSSYGINLNLAPVVDLNLNPVSPAIGKVQRSFSSNPAVVVQHSQALIDAHHRHGVLCTLKHFPGHGSSTGDTHLGFVDVTDSWQEVELEPYTGLLGGGQVDAVMTAHIFNGKLDPDAPATLSRPIITGILRERLGYDGVIISDDLRMRAISDLYKPQDAIQRAIAAGVDILAISNNIPGKRMISASQAFDIIRGLVDADAVSADRIDQSFHRIMRLKQKIGLVA
jgi:beta-N-acetylhexosaminidase